MKMYNLEFLTKHENKVYPNILLSTSCVPELYALCDGNLATLFSPEVTQMSDLSGYPLLCSYCTSGQITGVHCSSACERWVLLNMGSKLSHAIWSSGRWQLAYIPFRRVLIALLFHARNDLLYANCMFGLRTRENHRYRPKHTTHWLEARSVPAFGFVSSPRPYSMCEGTLGSCSRIHVSQKAN